MLSRLGQKSSALTNAFRTKGLMAAAAPSRFYGNMTQECKDHLQSLGINNKNVVFNPS